MKRSLSAFVILAVLLWGPGSASAQGVRYVDYNAPLGGDGLAWTTSYRYLQDALDDARGDDQITEIRIAAGVYTPDRDERGRVTPGQREAMFRIRTDLALLGGYRGHFDERGVSPDDRDPETFKTVLSGDLAGDDDKDGSNSENSLRILIIGSSVNPTISVLLSGLEFRGGFLDRDPDPSSQVDGAAVFSENCILAVEDCGFYDNRAALAPGIENTFGEPLGGALTQQGGDLTIARCRFVGNSTSARIRNIFANRTAGGGAISVMWSSLLLEDSYFENNRAEIGLDAEGAFGVFGGAVRVSTNSSVLDVTIRRCGFLRNAVGSRYPHGPRVRADGGAVGIMANGSTLSTDVGYRVSIEECVFEDNELLSRDGAQGGAVFYGEERSEVFDVRIADSVFDSNLIEAFNGDGGGVAVTNNANLTLDRCRFENNRIMGHPEADFSQGRGGAVLGGYAHRITDCDFIGNSVVCGGAIGGAITSAYAGTITRSRFLGNSATTIGRFPGNALGGAITSGNLLVTDSVFTGNVAGGGGGNGGAIHCSRPLVVRSSTFVANRVEDNKGLHVDGAAIAGSSSDAGSITNSIFALNTSVDPEAVGSVHGGFVVSYSITQAPAGTFEGEGAVMIDPQLVDPHGADGVPGTEDDDVRPAPGSPAIDAGSNALLDDSQHTDIEGNTRSLDGDSDGQCRTDLGAYEAGAPCDCPGDLTTTGAGEAGAQSGAPDGVVDLSDLLFFVNVWNTDLGAPSANPLSPSDVTTTGSVQDEPGFGAPDGNVDLADLLYYMNVWTAGRAECP